MSLNEVLKIGQLELWSKYKDKLRNEHKLTYLFWECTLNCNFLCAHCGSSAGNNKFSKNELSTEEIKKVFLDISKKYNPKEIALAITGGEPLLRKDLFEVMKFAHDLGFSWGMVTNGFLMTKEKALQAKEAGMISVVVSIDGLGKIHDDFRGVPGAYDHAIQAVKYLAEADFLSDLQITTTIHKNNIDSLDQMYAEFTSLPVTSLRFINADPIGRAEYNDKVLLDNKQLKRLIDFIVQKRKKAKKITISYGCAGYLGSSYEGKARDLLFNCNTGISTASILANGDIFVCPNVPRQAELVQGNVRSDDFCNVWENKFQILRDKNRSACGECTKCDDWDYCLGNSYHLWNFDKKVPKICHKKILADKN